MHLRKISPVLISLLKAAVLAVILTMNTGFHFVPMADTLGSGDSAPAKMTGEVFAVVESSLNQLNQTAHSRLPANEKHQVLKETWQDAKSLRKVAPVSSLEREIHLDFSVDSLEEIATDKNFTIEKCAHYKAKLLIDFEPMSEERPANPPLRRSYEIIEGICS